jgi:hypothetical protein
MEVPIVAVQTHLESKVTNPLFDVSGLFATNLDNLFALAAKLIDPYAELLFLLKNLSLIGTISSDSDLFQNFSFGTTI